MSTVGAPVTTYDDGFPKAPPAPPALSAALRGADLPLRGAALVRDVRAQHLAKLRHYRAGRSAREPGG
jgi:hypothetical protein